jgi:GDPmannose 4,6-dehydratase
MPTALITGIAGQDGSLLAEQLLRRGYRTCGVVRSFDPAAVERIASIRDRLELHLGDVAAPDVLRDVLATCQPDEIYHLASASSVGRSWADPARVLQNEAGATARLLEALRLATPRARVVLACSAEVFDYSDATPKNETSPLGPSNPYGVAKVAALWLARCYRSSYSLHISSALLFAHESTRRSPSFLSRKVTRAVAAIAAGRRTGKLPVGNLDLQRDWGAAEEYTEGLWRMAQEATPGDYVLGTGRTHSVRDLCEMAFSVVGLDYRDHVVSDPELFRPADPPLMVADPRLARERLGWVATRSLRSVVEEMVRHDREHLSSAQG